MHTAKHVLLSHSQWKLHHHNSFNRHKTSSNTCYYHSESYTITTVKVIPSQQFSHMHTASPNTCYYHSEITPSQPWRLYHHNSFYMHTACPNPCYYCSESYTITTISTCIQPFQTLITTAVKVKHQKCALRFYQTLTQRITRSTTILVIHSIACYTTSNT